MSSVTPRDGLSPHISLSLNLWNDKNYIYFMVGVVGVIVDVNGVGLVGGVVKLLSKGLWMAGSLSGWFIKSVVYRPLISHSSESSSFNRESQFIVNRSRLKCGPTRRSFYSPTSSSVQSVPELHWSVRWSREQFSSLGISPENWVLEDQMTV